MARMTNAQLVDENTKLRAHCAHLETQLEALRSQPHTRSVRPAGPKRVFEFDPVVTGDFVRASKLAKEFGGVVRRCV